MESNRELLFDQVSRQMAHSISRRQVARLTLRIFGCAALPTFLTQRVWAVDCGARTETVGGTDGGAVLCGAGYAAGFNCTTAAQCCKVPHGAAPKTDGCCPTGTVCCTNNSGDYCCPTVARCCSTQAGIQTLGCCCPAGSSCCGIKTADARCCLAAEDCCHTRAGWLCCPPLWKCNDNKCCPPAAGGGGGGGGGGKFNLTGGGTYLIGSNDKSLLRCNICGNGSCSALSCNSGSGDQFAGDFSTFNYQSRITTQSISISTLNTILFSGGGLSASGTAMATVNNVLTNVTFSLSKTAGITTFEVRRASDNLLLAGGTGEAGLADLALSIEV